jgi:hypothetical protein
VTASLGGGLLLALASAAALNWGCFVQHGVAAGLPPLTLRRPVASLRLLFGNLRWVVGLVVGIGGWVLYVAALALAPLSLVQAASAGGIGLLALLVVRGGGSLTTREWSGVGVASAGLVLLAVSLAGGVDHGHHASWNALGLWLAVSGVAAAAACGAGVFGAGAGILYAAGDVATKAAVAHPWLAPVVLGAHGLAFVCLQLGFQRGGALATIGVATLLTNALPIAAGMTIFDEPLPSGWLRGVRIAAFAAVVLGAVFLAERKHGELSEGGEPAPVAAS